MSHIKPTGTAGTSPVESLGDAAPAAPTEAAAAARPAATPSEAVVTALREDRVSPDEAVRQLTTLAMQGAGVPATMRPQIEARLRDLLGSDPTLGALMRRMGASVPEE